VRPVTGRMRRWRSLSAISQSAIPSQAEVDFGPRIRIGLERLGAHPRHALLAQDPSGHHDYQDNRLICLNVVMRSLGKHAAYAAGALAVVSGIAGIVSWWFPSSARWLSRHGLLAWPIATFSLILFIWATFNWYRSERQLAQLREDIRAPLPEDQRLFARFKALLPKDAPVLIWLRNCGDDRLYRFSDVRPLDEFVRGWRDAGWHFLNEDLERAAAALCESAVEYCSFRAQRSYVDRRITDKDDPTLCACGANDPARDEITRGLGKRADQVLAAHDELYSAGSARGM
jgi:hypothetical protein